MSSVSLASAHYVGRFAPSPSGPLHFGSLVSALGSYLQAKKNDGKWLLRIEDIDPPREVAGAADDIIECLVAHHLFWDEEVVYQSQRRELYLAKLEWLYQQGCTYLCSCTRQQLSHLPAGQLCHCSSKPASSNLGSNCAVRFRYQSPIKQLKDELLGTIDFDLTAMPAQFTLKRKDGLFAYQLAVVVDDIEQGITEVARGADLLPASAFQLALYQAFNCEAPKFLHFPVVVTEPGKKLSKQNHAPGLDNSKAQANLVSALSFLGLPISPQLSKETCENILRWAIDQWDINKLVATTERIDNRIGLRDSI